MKSPNRHGLIPSSCFNNEVLNFNRQVEKKMKIYNNVKMLAIRCRRLGATLSLTDMYGAAVAHYTHTTATMQRFHSQCNAIHTHTATDFLFPVCLVGR